MTEEGFKTLIAAYADDMWRMAYSVLHDSYEASDGRMVKSLCLGIDVAEAEDEEFCVVYPVKLGSERFDLGIY